jgi:hydrogenase maturation protein HypF
MSAIQRLHIVIRGAVQGVGFRPFVYRLTSEMRLHGWVSNTTQGVFIEVEGGKPVLDEFLVRIEREKPALSSIQSLEYSFLDPLGYSAFEIRESETNGETTALVLPDIAMCPNCLREIFDPFNRRYLYPFTNCTNCGPRFTIIESLPYDRCKTSMKTFEMCEECRAEYENPLDRRFHAQPNACPKCGPKLQLWNPDGTTVAIEHQALLHVASAIRDGKIVAVKGIGGFQLLVDARNEEAVQRLRNRKHREEKPFAVMFPTLDAVKTECHVSSLEERLLHSAESPIVLLKHKYRDGQVASVGEQTFRYSNTPLLQNSISTIAPHNPYLGVMLPYSPLHHILMRELGFPIVATSGNISDEPICIDESEALERLHGIADFFLVHNRPIVRHVDDSLVRIVLGRELVIRRARGYAPLPITLQFTLRTPQSEIILAVGGHLKNTVALTSGGNVFISQHIGDLETQASFAAFDATITSLQTLYKTKPDHIVADLHPNYLSTQHALRTGIPSIQIQHHYAHVASCMAENQIEGSVLGVSWDGTGYGLDGTIWGGEFLLTNETSFERRAAFRPFLLPGGEKAIREPRRTALGALYEIFGDRVFERDEFATLRAFSSSDLQVLRTVLQRRVNSAVTTSAGRLFDAVASILDIRQIVNFEGQAAMELEFAIDECRLNEGYEFSFDKHPAPFLSIDWRPMIEQIVREVSHGVDIAEISTKFHNTLTEIITVVAKRVGEPRIVLSGGCFQNVYLLERTVRRLQEEGFRPYWHQRVPPNDGGLSLGQIYAARRLNYSTPYDNKGSNGRRKEQTVCV